MIDRPSLTNIHPPVHIIFVLVQSCPTVSKFIRIKIPSITNVPLIQKSVHLFVIQGEFNTILITIDGDFYRQESCVLMSNA